MTSQEILEEFAERARLADPVSDISSDIPRGWHTIRPGITVSAHERRLYTLARKGRGQCMRCGNHTDGRARCETCRKERGISYTPKVRQARKSPTKAHAKYWQDLRKERKALRLCTTCGAPAAKVGLRKTPPTRCETCRQKRLKRT